MKTIEELRRIESLLPGGSLPRARAWGGADVVISKTPDQNPGSGWYPDPRYVVTRHVRELSWLFENLWAAFRAENRLDGQSKIEFFGRLANAANRCLARTPEVSAQELCAAVLHEAFAIYEEMENGTFESLAMAVDNEILDDYVDNAVRTGFVDIESTRNFFSKRGVDLGKA
jgi:hypothetical protein